MNPNLKSTRDAVLSGGAALVVSNLLAQHGVDLYTAAAIGLASTFLVARAYRAARKRWPWLADFDPSGK